MLDKRYQVFITTSGSEMQPERIILAQTLVGMGFFSWGLEQRTPLSTAFARRQIDDCDYVILLLGSKYGEQSVSGVGYMHLEYIYAVTKQKPIIVFMHDDPDARELCLHDDKAELREKFKEFRKLPQNEVDQVFTYRTMRDLEMAVRLNMTRLYSIILITITFTGELNELVVQIKSQIRAERRTKPDADSVGGDGGGLCS